jgi:hypothetical protein
VARYRLTIRHGSRVEREEFDDLDDAIAAVKERAGAIQREGPLDEISALRDYEAGDRVHARLELSIGGLLRGRDVGIDVRGDGALIPYTGVVNKRPLEPRDGETAFDALREALR